MSSVQSLANLYYKRGIAVLDLEEISKRLYLKNRIHYEICEGAGTVEKAALSNRAVALVLAHKHPKMPDRSDFEVCSKDKIGIIADWDSEKSQEYIVSSREALNKFILNGWLAKDTSIDRLLK